MISNMHSRTRLVTSILLIFTFLALSAASPNVQQISKKQCNLSVVDVELLGEVVFETGYMYADTEVGGLSGITYNHAKGIYYALSDYRISEAIGLLREIHAEQLEKQVSLAQLISG